MPLPHSERRGKTSSRYSLTKAMETSSSCSAPFARPSKYPPTAIGGFYCASLNQCELCEPDANTANIRSNVCGVRVKFVGFVLAQDFDIFLCLSYTSHYLAQQ